MDDKKDNKVISFEEYRKKRDSTSVENKALSELFNKDLREQKDLLTWYSFHNSFNAHKLFLHNLFIENHRNKKPNPNAAFFVSFSQEQMNQHLIAIEKALKWENRNYSIINAEQKTFRQMAQQLI